MKSLSERLKDLRAERRLQQKEVADAVGIGISTYQLYEYGKTKPKQAYEKALATFFDVSPEYLRGESDDRNGDGFELHAHRDPSVDGMPLEEALGLVEQLSKLSRLHDEGKLTDEEFSKLKKKIIG